MKIEKLSNKKESIVPIKDVMGVEKPNQIKPKVSFIEKEMDTLDNYRTNEEDLLKLRARRMSNQYEGKHPGSGEEYFVRERSVDSDCGVATDESVLDTLKKLVKSMNNEQTPHTEQITETLDNDKDRKREKYERKVNYFSPSSLYRRNNDLFRPEDEQKKKLRAMIEARVLRNVKNPTQIIQNAPIVETVCKLKANVSVATRKLSAFHPRKSAEKEDILLFDCEVILRSDKPSICQAKPSVQRLQDLATGWYCCYLTVRANAAWEKVKHSSDGIKKKCELFAPTAKNSAFRAAEVFTEDICKATIETVAVYKVPEIEEIEEGEMICWDMKVLKKFQ